MMDKVVVKADKNGIPTEIIMSMEQAEIIYQFMEGLRIGLLKSEEFAEDLRYKIEEELGESGIKKVNINFQRPNPKLVAAYIVREKYADREASDNVVDYEEFYNLLRKEIFTWIGAEIDMENTSAYDN